MFIYQITKGYPKDEIYGLTADTKRSANSVVHNIAEGFGRFEKRDKSRFYKISRASAYEIISQLLVAGALKFITAEQKSNTINGYREVILELDKLIKSVESRG